MSLHVAQAAVGLAETKGSSSKCSAEVSALCCLFVLQITPWNFPLMGKSGHGCSPGI